MKKNVVDLVGYLLTIVATGVGIVLNVLTIVRGDDASVLPQAIAFLVAFAAVFGIAVHQAVVRILRIVKDKEINGEGE